MSYSDSERWHFAASITRCARGVYLVEVDVGDDFEPHMIHWAAATPAKARRWARGKAHGPIHWVDHNINPGELVFGYVKRKHYHRPAQEQIDLDGLEAELVEARDSGVLSV